MSLEAMIFVGGVLLAALALGVLMCSFRIPYPVVFALLAVAVTAQPWLHLSVEPNVWLPLLIPPLLFYPAFHLDVQQWRADGVTLLIVGLIGTLLTLWGVAGILTASLWFDWPHALLLGALVVAMDPGAIRRVLHVAHAPRRLIALAEGEHLLSSLIPPVVLPIWVSVTIGEMTPVGSIPAYVRTIGGGIGVGLLAGSLVSLFLSQKEDPLLALAGTIVGAYGSYLLAWQLQSSGALASAVAGIVCGVLLYHRLSPVSRVALSSFWELGAFVATALGFLLAGFTLTSADFVPLWIPIVWAMASALILRVVVLYVLGLIRRGLGCTIPLTHYALVAAGGARGALGLLLALSLPATLIRQHELQVVTFGTVAALAVVQGVLSFPLLHFFRLSRRHAVYVEYQRLLARLLGVRAARQQLSRMYQEGAVAPHSWETVDAELGQQEMVLLESVQDFAAQHPEVQHHSLISVRREALRVQQHVLTNLSREGIISPQVAIDLIGKLNADLEQLYAEEANLPPL